MKIYKAPDNSVHEIDPQFSYLLPAGSIEITTEEANAIRSPAPSEPTLLDYDIAIERELDADAEVAGYRDPLGRIPSIDRACSYAGYPNPYQEEAQRFVLRRALAWQYAYQVKTAVEAGEREQPTIEQLISELPPRVTAQ
jgi:hypothetical protein